jgi:hypothetical protein
VPYNIASFSCKRAKRPGIIAVVAFALAVHCTSAAGAARSSRCHVEVLASEELPYALPGEWLLKATLRVSYPHRPTVVSTLARNSPWQTSLRRGDSFWSDCERLRDAWGVPLLPPR